MRKVNLLLAVFALALAFTSCKKDKTLEEERMDNLTDANWTIQEMLVDADSDGVPETSIIDFMDECSMDDYLQFKDDGSFKVDEGATKCEENDPQVSSIGNWAFVEEGQNMTITEDGDVTNVTIIELTGSRFHARFNDGDNTFLVTYTAQ